MLKGGSLWFWGRLPCYMAWELLLIHKLRDFSDGITFFELRVNTDFHEDINPNITSQNPQLIFNLIILNYTIFDFSIYSMVPRIEEQYHAKFKVEKLD
jgi:hypothetical protein